MSKRLKLGVIGCGVIGRTHCAAAAACGDIELAAVADLIPERGRAMAQQHGVARVYGSGDELLADQEIEAVVLAFPACPRTEVGLKAFAAGKHVLTEKPVAGNADDVRRLIAAARGAKRIGACCSSRYRFLTSSGVTETFLASGALGALRIVRARGINPAGAAPTQELPDWRLKRAQNGGGILMNWGCYDLDFVLGLTGWALRPRLVLAQCWTLAPHLAARATPGSDAETHGLAIVQCDDGIVLSFERAEFTSSAADHAHQFVGEKGTVRTVMHTMRKSVFHDHTDSQFGVLTRTLWEGDDPNDSIYSGPVRDFASAILHGHAPKTTLEQALIVQQITDAVYASSIGRCAVPIA